MDIALDKTGYQGITFGYEEICNLNDKKRISTIKCDVWQRIWLDINGYRNVQGYHGIKYHGMCRHHGCGYGWIQGDNQMDI